MKTRRNRKGGDGWGLGMFKSFGKSASNMAGVGNENTLNDSFLAEIKKLETTFADIDAFKTANPDKLPDVKKEVSDLGSLSGYSEAAFINAIVAHNTAYKMRQFDNTLGSDCGPKCAERAKSIRVALRKLVEYSERSDALGYIGMGRGAINNASYGLNSAASGVSKFGNLFSSTPKSVAPESQPDQSAQPSPQRQPQPQYTNSTSSSQQNAIGASMFGSFGGKRTRRRR